MSDDLFGGVSMVTENTPTEACGHLSYDDWLTPCELIKGHLCMHAARNALGPRREKCWWNYPVNPDAHGIAYGIMQPIAAEPGQPRPADLGSIEASWPWFP